MRVVYRLVSGYYVRSAFAEWRSLSERVVAQSTELEAQSEVLYLLLRRLRTLEHSVDRLPSSLDDLLRERESPQVPTDEGVNRAAEPEPGAQNPRNAIHQAITTIAAGDARVVYGVTAERAVGHEEA